MSDIIRELQAESSPICVTEIVRIAWDGGGIYLVNNNEGITSGGKEYTPCGFSFTPPSGEEKDGEISIHDTDGNLTYILQEKDRFEVEIAVIDTENPSEPLDGPLLFDAESFTSSSDGTCSITLSSRSGLSFGLSKLTYSSGMFPGLFG